MLNKTNTLYHISILVLRLEFKEKFVFIEYLVFAHFSRKIQIFLLSKISDFFKK